MMRNIGVGLAAFVLAATGMVLMIGAITAAERAKNAEATDGRIQRPSDLL